MKYNGPKARRCRRQGINLFSAGKYDKILQRKPHPAGKSPRARLGRQSEYAKQLLEKQKARDIYGLSERQFRKLFEEASAAKGGTGDRMRRLLEERFDNVLYRAGFAMTRLQARQFAGHGLFLLNGKRVTCPSLRVRAGHTITARPQVKSSPVFGPILAHHEKYLPPKWLTVDPGRMTITVTAEPAIEDAEQVVDMRQVVEFYSR